LKDFGEMQPAEPLHINGWLSNWAFRSQSATGRGLTSINAGVQVKYAATLSRFEDKSMAKATITFEDQPEGVAVRLEFDPPFFDFEDATEAQRFALATKPYIDELGDPVSEEPCHVRTDKGDE